MGLIVQLIKRRLARTGTTPSVRKGSRLILEWFAALPNINRRF
ncbi:MAG: hypothetical protein VYE03_04755 [Nitrospinota bacterium]|nr:hypothetical protein [Nitrospinota bacterium]